MQTVKITGSETGRTTVQGSNIQELDKPVQTLTDSAIVYDPAKQAFIIMEGKLTRSIPSVQGSPTLSLQNYIEYAERKIAWETAGLELAKKLMQKGKKPNISKEARQS